jgi:flagellar biosynthetic protein FliR
MGGEIGALVALAGGADRALLMWAAVFCRLGSCLMVAPGFSAPQVSMMPRLWIAVALSVAATPLCFNVEATSALGGAPFEIARILVGELAIGVFIGTLARLFVAALETLMSAVATMIGIANPFGMEIDHGDMAAPISSVVMIAATALIFVCNLHIELLRGLVESYSLAPAGAPIETERALSRVLTAARESFVVALRVCSPFVVYATVVNVATSLINRVTPQIAIYLLAVPFTVFGGLFMLYFGISGMLTTFVFEFARVLQSR